MRILITFCILSLIFIFSCNDAERNKKALPREQTYFLFSYTQELLDSTNNSTSGYKFSDFSKNTEEKDTLVSILKKFGWPHLVTPDNEVLISVSALQDIDNLLFLNQELNKRMKKQR